MDTMPVCPNCQKPLVPGAPAGLCPECLMKSGFDTRSANDPADGKRSFVPPSVEEMAKLLPQFEFIALLGQGGMGAVYKARQPRLDRFVALKILAPEKQNDPQFAERFQREARALASLSHPNIVAIYDFGEVQGIFYLVMEFVDGVTLRQLYQARKLAPVEALAIVPQICDALQFAHEFGIVHRDIKPENILLDKKGRVKIADFGIAKILDQDPKDLSLTDAKEVVGTPHYMAPEQLEKPLAVDCRADIYSLGVVFYEMLTGELPLGKFPPPSQKVLIDVRLDAVVLHALEKEPERRYQQASEVKTAVETIAASATATIPPYPQPAPVVAVAAPAPRSSTGVGVLAIVISVILILLVVVVVGALFFALFFGRTVKSQAQIPPQVIAVANPSANSNKFSPLLNENQHQAAQYFDRKYHKYFDARTFDGWPQLERINLERRMIDTLRGPRSDDYYRAINTLAALRSTNALPILQPMAFDHGGKILRVEISNRPRWMAVRAMSIIGDKADVPKIIHLLYHNNQYVRWSAQIALVELTGQNFGTDWHAWGDWWNSQHNQPPFDPQVILWWHGQADSVALAKQLAEDDKKFLDTMHGKSSPAARITPLNCILRNLQDEKNVPRPTDADIRDMVTALRDENGPVLALETDSDHQPLQMDQVAKGRYSLSCLDGNMGYFVKEGQECSATTAIKIIISYRNGNADWKKMADWDKRSQ